MLLRDKYHPKKLSDYLIHKKLTLKLKNFFINKDIPNLIIYGPYGSGKFSIAKSIIMEIFGEDVNNMNNIEYPIKIVNNTKLINVKYSNFHYEILINKYVFNIAAYTAVIGIAVVVAYQVFPVALNILLSHLEYCQQKI